MCEQYRYDLQLFVFVTASLTATSFVRGTQSTGALTPCFTKSEDNNVTVHSITGKWVEAPHILDQSDADSDITCRIGNGGPRSCAVQARKRREGAGHSFPLSSKAGVPRLFETDSCSLDHFDPKRFENALGGRTLHVFGDSLTMQHKGSLNCDLRTRLNSTDSGRQIFRAGGRIKFYRVSIYKNLLSQLDRFSIPSAVAPILERDLCLFNVGVHYNTREEFHKDFLKPFEQRCLRNNCLPCKFVWRESTQQHFPKARGGLFPGPNKNCKGCVYVSPAEANKFNWRNEDANELMTRYDIPVLPLWHMSVLAHDMHPEAGSYNHNGCDCTHFCNFRSGMFEAWTVVLQNFLQVAS